MEDSHILFIGSSTINDPVLNHITAENVDGSNCSETIKCSNGSNGTISVFGKAIGGYEDVLDVNRGNNCSFFIHEAVATGRTVATVKGNFCNIFTKINDVIQHGKEVDFDIGNHSDQAPRVYIDRGKSCIISVDRAVGNYITVRVLNAELPDIVVSSDIKVKYLFPWPWLGRFRWVFVAGWEWVVRPIGLKLFKKK